MQIEGGGDGDESNGMGDDHAEADTFERGQVPPQPHRDSESDDGGEDAGEESHVSSGRRDDDLNDGHGDDETERVGEEKRTGVGW